MNRRGFFAGMAGIAAAARDAASAEAKKEPLAKAPAKPQVRQQSSGVEPFDLGVLECVPVLYVGGTPAMYGIERKRVEVGFDAGKRMCDAWDSSPFAYEVGISGIYRGRRVEGQAWVISLESQVDFLTRPPTWIVELLPQAQTFRCT